MFEASIIVAAGDRPDLLRRALQSIIALPWVRRVEIVVVFDGPPAPDLRDVDAGRHVIRALPNRFGPGPVGARHTGVLAATAPLVAFCDAGEEWADAHRHGRRVGREPRVLAAPRGYVLPADAAMLRATVR